MIICNYGNDYNYELEKLTRLFMPFERIDVGINDVADSRKAITVTQFFNTVCRVSAKVFLDGKTSFKSSEVLKCDNFEKTVEIALAGCLFDCLVDIFDYKPCWGILTGIRPARLYLKTLSQSGEEYTNRYFSEVLRVDRSKLSLLSETAMGEEKIISLSKPSSFSLYVSIPFCPTRCSYCSFVSHSIEKASDIIPQYLQKLYIELRETAHIASQLNLNLETIYIGGGTPTTISANDLDTLLNVIENSFDLKSLREFTVEAGRPDTITLDKLSVLKKHSVTRISINPQTLNDDVLEKIGRKHTVADFFNSFYLARKVGFENINTDLIAGLPNDSFDSFKHTVDSIVALSPESVTIHTLSMKRSSTLATCGFQPIIDEGKLASEMVDYARYLLKDNNILPYYMYRQSKTVGNLENVGYAKPGFAGLYNVYIMDETHTILACGASAVTKLKDPLDGRISRIFNYKYPYEYISRFDEQMIRKQNIYSFYNAL